MKTAPEFNTREGLTLALSYLVDPSDVECPICGPGEIEVVAFVESNRLEDSVEFTAPEGDYTVILYCHGCGRAAALDLSPS